MVSMGGTSEPKVHAEKEEIVKEVDGVMRLPSCLIYAALRWFVGC